jgi:holliday junction DNA helicase RuvA
MITHLNGQITECAPSHIVIDCHGVGYLAKISLRTYEALKSLNQCLLYTTVVIREDAHTLFGFSTQDERQWFEYLMSVNGVGGNMALSILSSLSPIELQQALVQRNVDRFKKIRGVGPKSAERIIIDLADKAKIHDTGGIIVAGSGHSAIRDEALLALVSLGFSRGTMEKRIAELFVAQPQWNSVEELIKACLKG